MGQTILGGVIGAAVGLAANLGLEISTQKEMTWFPIIIGLLTGLGVRQINKSEAMRHASYLRGAIAGLIALAAIAGAPKVKAMVMAKEKGNVSKPTAAQSDDEPGTKDDGAASGDAADEPAEPEMPRGGDRVGQIGMGKAPGGPGDPDVWQAVFMAVGTFLAYEFARGSGAPVHASGPADDVPVGGKPTDPSE